MIHLIEAHRIDGARTTFMVEQNRQPEKSVRLEKTRCPGKNSLLGAPRHETQVVVGQRATKCEAKKCVASSGRVAATAPMRIRGTWGSSKMRMECAIMNSGGSWSRLLYRFCKL